jgi:hypothetical protein
LLGEFPESDPGYPGYRPSALDLSRCDCHTAVNERDNTRLWARLSRMRPSGSSCLASVPRRAAQWPTLRRRPRPPRWAASGPFVIVFSCILEPRNQGLRGQLAPLVPGCSISGKINLAIILLATEYTLAVRPRARSAVWSKRRRPRATLHEGADKTDEGDSVGFGPRCISSGSAPI